MVLDRRTMLQMAGLGGAAFAIWVSRASGGILNDKLAGDITPVHDPCAIKMGDTYYVFSTGPSGTDSGLIPCRTSKDLIHWMRGKNVFDTIPQWATDAIPNTKGIWAPDISFFNGKYYLYYAVSTFGSNHSVIGLATNTTLDPAAPGYAWHDEGPVIGSNSYDHYNCIDPCRVIDRDGKHWLTFGSFWTGIKMVALDPATGKPANDDLHAMAQRPAPPDAIEASFITEHGGYYYLFVSYDFCCRGANSDYNIVAGRSKDILGTYMGPDGTDLMHGGGQQVLLGNNRFKGPGGQSVLDDGDRQYLVYHAYDAQNGGIPTLRVSPLQWTPDGWPSVIL